MKLSFYSKVKSTLTGYYVSISIIFLMCISSNAFSQINPSATSWSVVGNNIISLPPGNVGIGTNNPLYKLDVIGDARISNNLYVGGGIVITDKVQATHEVITMSMRADSIVMNGSRAIYGDTRVEGDIDAKHKLNVVGDASFSGQLISPQGLMFDGNNGLKMTSQTNNGNTTNYFTLGKITTPLPVGCLIPNINQWMINNGGGFVSAQQNPTGAPFVNGSLRMYCAGWNGSGFIEVEGVNEAGAPQNALFMNYFCGRDIGICVNTGLQNGGGKVSVGNFLSAARHVEIGDPTWGINSTNALSNNVALDLHVNIGNAIKVKTSNGSLSMFEIVNVGLPTPKIAFKVDGNGKTQIGIETLPSRPNSQLTVSGEIDCKALYVLKPTTWQDKVFEKSYVLQDLKEVEKFIKLNKHLPGIKSEKEILEKGYDVNETDAALLEKIENLYLYIIEQQKEIDELKKSMIKNK